MTDPIFVPHITIDGIITVLSIVIGGVIYLIKTGRKIDLLSSKVDEHGAKIDKLSGIVETQARHDERIMDLNRRVNVMDQRWEEIRHGRGLVVE